MRLSAILLVLLAASALAEETPRQRVGQPLEIREVYIPGAEVRPKPRHDRKPPLTVRLLEMRPAKDGLRYDFEVQGLEAGTYNLADFLEAPEGTTLPAIPLEITTALEPGLNMPHPAKTGALPQLGGYKDRMITYGVIWLVGLIALLLWRKKKADNGSDEASGPSLAERMKPLLDQAVKGTLSSDERAKLERLLIGHWREKLPEIAALSPAEAMVKLRDHPEASPLVLALERWLHARDAKMTPAELESLLAPYR